MKTIDTYRDMLERARVTARGLVDESCDFQAAVAGNSYAAWESYLESLDDLDVSDLAHSEADNWDLVIYYGKALALVNDAWSGELSQAEDSLNDCGFEFESFNQICCLLAYWLVYHAISEAIEPYIEELREMASSLQQNTES
jgi:hypothetical protein